MRIDAEKLIYETGDTIGENDSELCDRQCDRQEVERKHTTMHEHDLDTRAHDVQNDRQEEHEQPHCRSQ